MMAGSAACEQEGKTLPGWIAADFDQSLGLYGVLYSTR